MVETRPVPRTSGSQLYTFWAGGSKQTSAEKLSPRIQMLPIRRTSPRDFQHGQWVQSQSALCSQRKALLQSTCACSVALSHSNGSGYTACPVCSDTCFIFRVFLVLFSLPTVSPCCLHVSKPYLSLERANSNAIPLQSLLWFHYSTLIPVWATNVHPLLWISKRLYLYITYDNTFYLVL